MFMYWCIFVLLSDARYKLYKCGSQNISKQSTFVVGRLKTAVLLQKPWFTAFLSRMSRKTQHTRFEDKILRKLANEDKPQVVTAWCNVMCISRVSKCIRFDQNQSKLILKHMNTMMTIVTGFYNHLLSKGTAISPVLLTLKRLTALSDWKFCET